jgi:hypothetical protein
MASVTFKISTEHNIYPNLTVYDRFADDAPVGWKLEADEGYVFYDQNANNTEIDPETMEQRPAIYYYTITLMPRNYNWNNFAFVAVPRGSVNENYIFGVGGSDHETM